MKELLRQYREQAARRGRALIDGDTRTANSAFTTTERIWTQLVKVAAPAEIQALLTDDDPGVRLLAAGKMLKSDPLRAIPVLEQLAHQSDLIGLSAAATLEANRRYPNA